MARKILLLTAAAMLATPTGASARDRTAYFGLHGGLTKPQDVKLDYQLRTLLVEDGVVLKHKTGLDADIVAGFDLGFLRIEGELGYKKAGLKDVTVSESVFATTARPTINGRTTVASAMANLLLDFGSDEGLQVYAGGGVGGARLDVAGRITGAGVPLSAGIYGDDRSIAWQLLAGVRVPVNYNVDLGMKYRFFNSRFEFRDDNSGLGQEGVDGRFRSHSVLASLIFNLGSPPAPVPVAAEPAPPAPPPPPTTQTCPDGAVILTTDLCPVPPPPPPPPPAPERG